MNFNKNLAKAARRTAAVIGSGMVIGGTIAAPILAPVANVYAADSYETEKTDYNAKLKTAKKTPYLTVKEKKETVEVLASQAEAKKQELAAKIDGETAKLQNAITQQKANNDDYNSKVNDPDFLLESWDTEFTASKEKMKDLLTTKAGEFNYSRLSEFAVTGGKLETNASGIPDNEYEVMAEKLYYAGREKFSTWYVKSGVKADEYMHQAILDGKVFRVKKGDTFTFKGSTFNDAATGKPVDVKFTITDLVNETDLNNLPEYEGFNELPYLLVDAEDARMIMMGTLKGMTMKVEFLDPETGESINIDTLACIKDIDTYQSFTINNYEKTAVADNTIVDFNNGRFYADTDRNTTDQNRMGWGLAILRDKNGFTFSFEKHENKSRSYSEVIAFDDFDLGFNEIKPVKSSVEVTTYELNVIPDPQKGSVTYIDQTTNKTLETKKLDGVNNEPFNYSTTDTIKKYTDKGYELVSSDYPKNEADQKFDTDPNTDQDYTVVLKQKVVNIPPTDPGYGVDKDQLNKTITRTVYYKYESKDGKDVFEPVVQTVKLTRSATKNLVTGETTFTPWTEGKMDELTTKAKKNYTFDRAKVDGVNPVKADTKVNDEYVIYTKIPQKGSVKFTDKDTKEPITDTKKLNGHNEEPFGYTPDATIKKLEDKGYDLVSNNFPKDEKDQVYDTDPDVDQNFEVVMTPHIETITPDKPKTPGDPARPDVPYPEGLQEKDLNKTLTRTIYYKYDTKDGEDVFKPVKQTVKLTRTATFNYVTGEIKYSNWTTGTIKDVTSPDKENYTYDRSVVEGVPEVTTKTKLEDQYVIYKKIPQKGSVDFKDRDTGEDVAPKKSLDGFQAEPFNYTPDSTIKKLESNGWDLISNDFPTSKDKQVYDTDPETNQDYHVVLTPHVETITPDDPKTPGSPTDRDNVKYPEGVDKDDLNKTFSRTIYYKYETPEGENVFEPVEQTVTLTRTATFNYVSGEVVYSDWTTASIEDVTSPEKAHWQFDIDVVKGVDLTSESEPLEDVYVIYTKIPEKGKMEFTDEDGKPIADTHNLDGFDEEPFDYNPAPVLEDLHNKGWDLIENTYPENPEDQVFDSDPNVDQDFKAVHTPHIETIKPDDPKKPGSPTDRKDVTYPEGVDEADLNKTFTRTIYFKYNDKNGDDVFEPITQTVKLTREAKFNYVTGEVEYTEWTTALMDGVDAKAKDGYTFDRDKIDELLLTGDSEMPGDEFIIYTPIPEEEAPVTPSTPVSTPSVTPDTGNKDKTGIFAAIGAGAAAAIAGAVAVMKRRKKTEE